MTDHFVTCQEQLQTCITVAVKFKNYLLIESRWTLITQTLTLCQWTSLHHFRCHGYTVYEAPWTDTLLTDTLIEQM